MGSRTTGIKMRGQSATASIYTLKLDADGKAILHDSRGVEIWHSDDEEADDFNAEFGDFIDEEETDALVDWIFEHVALPDDSEIEVQVEYEEDEGDEEDEEDEDEEDEDEEDDVEEDGDDPRDYT